jgi:hypothetical protein
MKRVLPHPGTWRRSAAAATPPTSTSTTGTRGGVVVHHHRGAMRRTGPCHADCPGGRVTPRPKPAPPDGAARRCWRRSAGAKPRSVRPREERPSNPPRSHGRERPVLAPGRAELVDRLRPARCLDLVAGNRPRPLQLHRAADRRNHDARIPRHGAGSRPRRCRERRDGPIRLLARHGRAVGIRLPCSGVAARPIRRSALAPKPPPGPEVALARLPPRPAHRQTTTLESTSRGRKSPPCLRGRRAHRRRLVAPRASRSESALPASIPPDGRSSRPAGRSHGLGVGTRPRRSVRGTSDRIRHAASHVHAAGSRPHRASAGGPSTRIPRVRATAPRPESALPCVASARRSVGKAGRPEAIAASRARPRRVRARKRLPDPRAAPRPRGRKSPSAPSPEGRHRIRCVAPLARGRIRSRPVRCRAAAASEATSDEPLAPRRGRPPGPARSGARPVARSEACLPRPSRTSRPTPVAPPRGPFAGVSPPSSTASSSPGPARAAAEAGTAAGSGTVPPAAIASTRWTSSAVSCPQLTRLQARDGDAACPGRKRRTTG